MNPRVGSGGCGAADSRLLVVAPDRAFPNLYLSKAAHGNPLALACDRNDDIAFNIVVSTASLAFHRAAKAVHIDIAEELYEVAGVVIAPAVAIMAIATIDPHQLTVLDGGTEEPDGCSALGRLVGHSDEIGTHSLPSQFDLDNLVPILFTNGMDRLDK